MFVTVVGEGWLKLTIGDLGQIFIESLNADVILDFVVIRLKFFVAKRPIDSLTID